ncbi:MAG: hypothetical protein IMF26_01175 [Candidatus Fermentithermobacillus carboniphilus]|uniref:Uncharacterized protein n=1 Tax=Candidatus Fermentithermobacillus carboniphilus TaxID=3085328 RepID=A0AAT9LDE7_9FIRM|nr:MAG: hypothetical protein IMF26_01175 [Candidatus Fermentithermobacillus carboniphilus]
MAVLIGILRLELGNKDIVLISDSDHKFIARDGSEEPLTKLLAAYGWQFVDRLGSGIFYRRDGQTLYVDARMFTRRYVIYDLEHHP